MTRQWWTGFWEGSFGCNQKHFFLWIKSNPASLGVSFRGSSGHFCFDHFYIVDFHSALTTHWQVSVGKSEGWVKIYNIKMVQMELACSPPKTCQNKKSIWIPSNTRRMVFFLLKKNMFWMYDPTVYCTHCLLFWYYFLVCNDWNKRHCGI